MDAIGASSRGEAGGVSPARGWRIASTQRTSGLSRSTPTKFQITPPASTRRMKLFSGRLLP